MLAGLGAEVADADQLAREALEGPAAARAVERILGEGVRRADGSLDRAAVAARVFGPRGAARLRRLEAFVHPGVLLRLRRAVAEARRRRAPAVALDVPLLFERGVDRMCDVVLFVDAPRAVRLRRARARGWSAAQLRARDASQWPAATRRRRADAVIANGGGRAAARKQVRALWKRFVATGA
jgi:dephospho-CoA kinase